MHIAAAAASFPACCIYYARMLRLSVLFLAPKLILILPSRMKRCLLSFLVSLVLLVLQGAYIYGQEQWIVQQYTNENGLPVSGIKALELDKASGFLWVGTQAGLIRFDGAHFKNFNAEGKAVARIALLSKNREGTIFCEDDNFMVYRIAGHQPEFAAHDTIFYPFFQSKRWQALYNSAVKLKDKLKRHQPGAFLPHLAFFHKGPEAGNFSFLLFDHAYHYNAASDSLSDFPGIRKIVQVSEHTYFIDSALNFWEYNNHSRGLVHVPVQKPAAWGKRNERAPSAIWQPGMAQPLVIRDGGIWELGEKHGRLSWLPVCEDCYPAGTEIITAQKWDEQGIIFLGSPTSGLYVMRKAFARSLPGHNSRAGTEEYAQAELAPGIIATGSGRIFSVKDGWIRQEKKRTFNPLTIFEDSKGDRWFHAHDTVFHYHALSGQYTWIALGDGSEKMTFAEIGNRMYVFSDRAFGAITNGRYELLYKLPYAATDKKNWLNPDAVVELEPGLLAIATEKLMLFDLRKRTKPITIPIPDLTAKVRALLKFGDYLLIGTYGQGIYMYKDGTLKKMPADKRGYLLFAHCFVPDQRGFCWISTNHGLFKVSFRALEKAYEEGLPEIYYHYLGREDGIAHTELNGGCQPCALQLSSGLLSFPSMNGLVVVDPSKPHMPPPDGKVFIDEVKVDSATYLLKDNQLPPLPYNTRYLKFGLAFSRFGNAENIYFSYKLEQEHNTWQEQDITQNNTLLFGGLKPGTYKLHLRVRNGFEADQFRTTVITFRVLTPWFQEWWFLLACLLAFTGLIAALFKWRTGSIIRREKELQLLVNIQTEDIAARSKQLKSQLAQLREQQVRLEEDNKIKSRLISIISHDIISPLQFMGYLGDKVLEALHTSDKNHRAVSYMKSVAHDLESLTVSLLNWIRFHHESLEMAPEAFSLDQLIKEVSEIPSTLAGEKNLDLIKDIPEMEVCQYRQAMGVIIYNLLMNAVKYTEHGSVKIKSYYTANGFAVSVADTGPGMAEDAVAKLNDPDFLDFAYSANEKKKYRFGFVIIKDLLRLSGGSMTVRSDIGQGTEITIAFPHQGQAGYSGSNGSSLQNTTTI